MTPVKRRHKSSQVLHFRSIVLRSLSYISYHSPLKRCLKDTSLLPLLTCVFPSMTIYFFAYFALAGLACFLGNLALLLSLWVVLWFKTTATSSEAVMFNFDTKDFHRLVFCVQRTCKSSQVERNLRWNLNKFKLVAN